MYENECAKQASVGAAIGPHSDVCEQISPRSQQIAAGRPTAKGVIRDLISRKQREILQLQALHDCLPERLPSGADDALRTILIDARR
jgi:hypothetical protein